ncbi:hypothetical protein LMG33810_002434 [Carnimonas sp. LMG 33810]
MPALRVAQRFPFGRYPVAAQSSECASQSVIYTPRMLVARASGDRAGTYVVDYV